MNFQNPEFPDEDIKGAIAVLTINLDLVGCGITQSYADVTNHTVSFKFHFEEPVKIKTGMCDGLRINVKWTKTFSNTKTYTILAKSRLKTEGASLYYPDPIYCETFSEKPTWMSVGREIAAKITDLTIYQD